MALKDDDFTPVTGGAELAEEYVREDLDWLRRLKVESDLDRHLVRLLALHKQLRVRFRNLDWTRLDDAAKQTLLQEMNDILRIRPLHAAKEQTGVRGGE
jgi:hypothetical protein